MKFWLQYIALKVGVLPLLLTATVLFAVRYPAMWMPVEHSARWQSIPIEMLAVTRWVLPVLLVAGWVVYAVAAKRLGRPQ